MYKLIGGDNCSFCKSAKQLLESKGLTYDYIDVMKDREAQALFREKGLRKIPQIWKGDEYIGGFDKLSESFKAA